MEAEKMTPYVGHEKKFKVAQENIERFLYESITFSKREKQVILEIEFYNCFYS